MKLAEGVRASGQDDRLLYKRRRKLLENLSDYNASSADNLTCSTMSVCQITVVSVKRTEATDVKIHHNFTQLTPSEILLHF
jgi:hypothetical protein